MLHALVWLVFFSLPIYNTLFGQQKINFSFLTIVVLCITIFYINFIFIVPKYMIKKKWAQFFFLITILFLIHSSIFLQIDPLMPGGEQLNKIPVDIQNQINLNPFIKIFPGILLFVLIISMSSFLRIYDFWNENFKRQKEIENENRITELNFLKAQLNPHFFFNSLNTIYSLSISKSEKTSEAILNLSELMRYMLIDKKDNSINRKVKLNDEINYITNYIELQKLRITHNNNIHFSVSGNTNNIQIYPLLFISFIENAFKFGIHPINESTIEIAFIIKDNYLKFNVINDCHFQKNSYDSFGLGNENSIKRLELYYPNKNLKIEQDTKYSVSLEINLNEN